MSPTLKRARVVAIGGSLFTLVTCGLIANGFHDDFHLMMVKLLGILLLLITFLSVLLCVLPPDFPSKKRKIKSYDADCDNEHYPRSDAMRKYMENRK